MSNIHTGIAIVGAVDDDNNVKTSTLPISLTELARKVTQKYPFSDIEAAIAFCSVQCPSFVGESNDRLVKVGRSIRSILELSGSSTTSCSSEENNTAVYLSDNEIEESLQLLKQECELIVSGKLKIPTVPFGKTGINMPIVTLGCMRFQQEWGPRINAMNMIYSDCQDNLVSILRYAICKLNMYHIETARGYGCSEIQLGTALKQLILNGECKRSDLIMQTKVGPNKNANEFRKTLETSLCNLQMDYIDLFAFHGLNLEEQWDYIFGKPCSEENCTQNCLEVVQEYVKAGKIRHVGFSTHASTNFIIKCIETNVFEYVNLHYHYFGSYTASGCGQYENLECIELLNRKQMGVFIISPFDKGGRLYAPSQTLRSLTLPYMEPMSFMSYWIWNHHQLQKNMSGTSSNGTTEVVPLLMHTYTVGAGRPSDLDQPAVAAYLHSIQNDTIVTKLETVVEKLDTRKIQILGTDWVNTWWKGLPKNDQCTTSVEHNQIVWIYNNIKAFGMYEFGKARYNSMETNYYNKWNETMSTYDNIHTNVGVITWGYVPGVPLLPYNYFNQNESTTTTSTGSIIRKDYSLDLQNVPIANRKRIIEAELFVYTWCRNVHHDKKNNNNNPLRDKEPNTVSMKRKTIDGIEEDDDDEDKDKSMVVSSSPLSPLGDQRPFYGTSFVSSQEYEEIVQYITKEEEKKEQQQQKGNNNEFVPPPGWKTSYDMRPWPDYPDQPKRN